MRALVATHRLGYSLRPEDPRPEDPQAWVERQFARYDPRPWPISAEPRTAEVARTVAILSHPAAAGGRSLPLQERRANRAALADFAQATYAGGARARLAAALASEAPFVERLVHFWANHFAVSRRGRVVGLAPSLEFDVVRPHVLGRFEDMFMAAMRHPALLEYLDQTGSMGPNSGPAMRRNRYREARGGRGEFGPNENFAREVLELHSLGVDGGYDQQDVVELSLALTGWSIAHFALRTDATPAEPGAFVFHAAWHEPGPRRILGRTYPAGGIEQPLAVLTDLAAHPSTARHVARKLARHFVADEPPEPLVARMAERFLATRGDLPSVYLEMVRAPETLLQPFAKVRTPWDWTVAALRALGVRSADGEDWPELLRRMGQPVWGPGSPAGWPDLGAAWAGSNLLLRRIEVAMRIGEAHGASADPAAVAEAQFGPLLSEPTRRELARAETPAQAVALLLLGREFHRR